MSEFWGNYTAGIPPRKARFGSGQYVPAGLQSSHFVRLGAGAGNRAQLGIVLDPEIPNLFVVIGMGADVRGMWPSRTRPVRVLACRMRSRPLTANDEVKDGHAAAR